MKILISTLIIALFTSTLAFADGTVASLQQDWANIKYQLDKNKREAALTELTETAENALKNKPQDAELLIWHGIILSTLAGEKGGIGALTLVKQAKQQLEQALEINDQALSGSAYTSLGALYYQVPGWPIGFGNNKKAKTLLEKGLAINPDGIDSNFFYGDFLLSQHQNDQARAALQHALAAPDRPGRTLADNGRRQEIHALLKKIEKTDS